ncbi:MAG: (d)CMP kinase [Minwuia sp.]|uniref:(d)CMP kinase n=1 Tax=Minwuia sp. TaxID=2493630 RepID=UPI003A8AED02
MKNVIAVDGPTASGKGTLARRLAAHFGYDWLDTGALYRATALGLRREGITGPDEATAVRAAEGIEPDDLSDPALREEATGNLASTVAAIQPVRDALFRYQRDFAANPPGGRGAVLDGRDIGTVICPDAPAKLFVTASDEVRAGRRFRELTDKGVTVKYEDVLEDLRNRDARDQKRSNAPLSKADDAVLIDTTELDIEAAFSACLKACLSRLDGKNAG